MEIKTRIQALAVYWGCDVEDVKNCRYQSTRTNIPVFTSDENYWCATKKNERPASGDEWCWTEQIDNYVNKYGWRIWKA
jgi:hypothetical protein